MEKILVTGGLGFIGSYICEALLAAGHKLRVIDNLDPQVHQWRKPGYAFLDRVEFSPLDVADPATWPKALEGIDAVVHEASAVGVGQSQYQISHYTRVNVMGTAHMLDYLANHRHGVKRILLAASMSSYGEGRYVCGTCGTVRPPLRRPEDVEKFGWEPRCPSCCGPLSAETTRETDLRAPNSVYALNKAAQEDMLHCFGFAYGIPTVALRYFNVYGPRQSLSNPYTGVLAIFTSRLKNGHSPVIYEDGLQTRDFVHVRDVAAANVLALRSDKAGGLSFNIGSGKAHTILEVAQTIARLMKVDLAPEVTGRFRKGDVRHCFASIEEAGRLLGFQPRVSYEEGLADLIAWSKDADAVDRFETAAAELKQRNLV